MKDITSQSQPQIEKLSCNLCIFCADIKNSDGSIFCMLHKRNNPIGNSCGELIDNRSTKMSIQQVLELAREKRGETKKEVNKAGSKKAKIVFILLVFFSLISFILGFLAGGIYPKTRNKLLNIIKSTFQK